MKIKYYLITILFFLFIQGNSSFSENTTNNKYLETEKGKANSDGKLIFYEIKHNSKQIALDNNYGMMIYYDHFLSTKDLQLLELDYEFIEEKLESTGYMEYAAIIKNISEPNELKKLFPMLDSDKINVLEQIINKATEIRFELYNQIEMKVVKTNKLDLFLLELAKIPKGEVLNYYNTCGGGEPILALIQIFYRKL